MAYATPRSQINQKFQIGAEVSPGTGGTAKNQLGTFNSQIGPVGSGAFGLFRPSGGKYVGQVVPSDLYAEGAYTDTIDFRTIPFLFAANIGWAAPVGTGPSYVYTFTPVTFGAHSGKTFVVEEGQDGAFYNYNNVVVPDLGMRFTRTGQSQLTGRVLGRKGDPDSGSMTTATLLVGRSISGLNTGVYSAANWAGLATGTRLAPPALDVAFRHNGIFGPWFCLDDSVESFGGLTDGAADAGVQVSMLADVDASDIKGVFKYSTMEDGDFLYLKVLNTGPIIPTTVVNYLLDVRMCLKISGPPRRGEQQGLRVWQWDTVFTPDPVSGKPFEIAVTTDLDPTAFSTT